MIPQKTTKKRFERACKELNLKAKKLRKRFGKAQTIALCQISKATDNWNAQIARNILRDYAK